MPARRKEEDEKDEIAVTIRFPAHVHAAAAKLARDDQRSFNLWIVRAIARAASVDPESSEKKKR